MTAVSAWQRIKKRIKGYGRDVVGLQRALTALPALGPHNGGKGEWAKARYLEARLKTLKPERILRVSCPDRAVPEKNRPNLIALFKGRDTSRKIWILSHLDVVPPGDLRLWKSDPFRLKLRGEVLIGRGVEDNHHGLISSFMAVKALQEERILPAFPVGLVFVSDEETGSRKGLEYVLKKKRRLFGERDLIVVPDAGNRQGTLIEIAEKSLLWLKFTLQGRQCHASRPDLGRNTLRGTARMIMALEKLPRIFSKIDSRFDVPFSTFEPTQKEANVPNINTIPGQDVFYLDCRILPKYPLAEVLSAIRALVSETEAQTKLRIAFETVNAYQAPPATSEDAPVVRALQKGIKAVYRKEAFAKGIGGATVAAFFRREGLPAAVWMTSSDSAHQPNESCRLSHLIGDAQVLAHVFLEASSLF